RDGPHLEGTYTSGIDAQRRVGIDLSREELPTHGKYRRIRRDGSINLLASATVIADKLGDDVLLFWLYVTRGLDLAAKQVNYLRLTSGHRRRGPRCFSRYHRATAD